MTERALSGDSEATGGRAAAPRRGWIDGRGDFGSAMTLIRSGELAPADWLRAWAGARSFSTFALDDPGPFLKKYDYGRSLVLGPVQAWRKRRGD